MFLRAFTKQYNLQLLPAVHTGIRLGNLVWKPFWGLPKLSHPGLPNHISNALYNIGLLDKAQWSDPLDAVYTEGKVGVGTTTPTVAFEVIGEGDFRTVYIADSSSAASTISAQATTVIDDGDWAADSSNSRWYLAKLSDNTTVRSGTNRVVIDDSGNLGLGTASPDDQLEVTGSAQFAGVVKDALGSAGTAGQILSSTASGVAWISAGTSSTDSQTIAFDDASATATETTITLDNSQALTLIASGTLSMSNSNSTTLLLTASDDSDWSSDAANSLWQLGTQSDKSTARTLGTEFVITDAGIVGIGVTSVNASARLDVNGDVYAAEILLTSDNLIDLGCAL